MSNGNWEIGITLFLLERCAERAGRRAAQRLPKRARDGTHWENHLFILATWT